MPNSFELKVNRLRGIESIETLNLKFSDSGVFGLSMSGDPDETPQMLEVVWNEINKLKFAPNIQELEKAQNMSIANIFQNMERQPDRLEEVLRNQKVFGRLFHRDYPKIIRSVTPEAIQNVFQRRIETYKPYIVVQGPNAQEICDSLMKH